MIIGIDIRTLMTPERTGVGIYTEGLLHALFSADKENQYMLLYNAHTDVSAHIPKWQQDNVTYIKKNWPNKLFSTVQGLGLKSIDTFIDKRIEYFFSPNLNFTNVSKKTKHIITVHDLSFVHMPECYSHKRQWWHTCIKPKQQIQRAWHILTPSQQTKQDVIEWCGINEQKVSVIPHGIDQAAMVQDAKKTEVKARYQLPEKYILTLGTLEPRKNIESVIDAYKKSGLFEKNTMLVVAGPQGWREEAIIKKIQYTSGVHYIGYIKETDKATLYNLAEICVFPSFYEGFGFPVLEAMAQGTPVITSNRTSLPEITQDAACLVNPMNVDDIVRGMHHISQSQTYRSYLIDKGYTQANIYTWEKTARDFLAVLYHF